MNDSMKMFYEADAKREQARADDWCRRYNAIFGEIADHWRRSLFMRDERYAMTATQALEQMQVVGSVHDEVLLAPESELDMVRRLAEKHGMVLMQAPSETVLTEAVDPEPVNTTPRGLTMVAALGGVRMGCAAWQND